MFCVIYRWRIKPELEKQFIENWSKITGIYIEDFGGKGSRLHRGEDGLFYAYAQWNSDEDRRTAFQDFPESSASEKMREAIIERFPEIKLESVADFLQYSK